MVKVLVVEDEIIIADNLCNTLQDLGYHPIEPALNYTEAVELIASDKPDLVILDINLGGKKTGIDLAKYIQENTNTPFIFLTSNTDIATINAVKELNPPAFLVKPYTQEEIFSTIEIVLFNFKNTEIENFIYVKEKGTLIKVNCTDITHIKSEHVYIEIHLTNRKKHVVRDTLTSILEKLPSNFIQVHRSFLVNRDFFKKINQSTLEIKGANIPIGRSFKKDLLKKLNL